MKRGFESNIWKYYLFTFFRHFMLILPIYILFFQENGLNLSEIMFLTTTIAIVSLFLEIPSGVFADLYGRKTSLIIGALFLVFGASLRATSYTFHNFIIAAIVAYTGFAFISGANKALLYDSLKEIKRENEFKRIAGNANFIHLTSMALAGLAGGFLATYGLRAVHYMTIIPMVLLFITSFSFKEPKEHKKVIKSSYLQHLKEGISFSFTHKRVRNLILFSSFMVGLMFVSHQFFQPFMKNIGIPVESFGIIYMLFLGVSAFSSKYAYWIEERLGEKKAILMIPILLALQLIFMGLYPVLWGVLFIFLGEFTWGFINPIVSHYINEHVESSHRATILSINTMGIHVVRAAVGPFIGWIADLWTLQTALIAEGVIVAIIAVIILSSWKLRKSA